jgi:ABC-type dipeptide/oligopeptide/nickel transport system permease subunit
MADSALSLPPRRTWWSRFWHDRVAAAGASFILLAIVLSLAGPGLYAALLPVDQQQLRDGIYQDYSAINAGPSGLHWFGADYLGRDVLTRLLTAIRVSLTVALTVEAINIGVGALLGMIAGYFGGVADMLISRLADMLFAFPGLLLAILVSAVFGETARNLYGSMGRLLLVSSALSLVSWPLMARYLRSQALALKSRDFIVAARSLGASDAWIIARHLVPNVAWLIIVATTLDVASVIVNEATLSLLGLGIEEPGASLGLMIFKAASRLEHYPLQLFFPAATITLLVLAFSFLGDGLRDVLEGGSHR